MVDVMNLRHDSEYQTKTNILAQLQSEGFIDQLRTQLRSQVVKKLEAEKKKSYSTGASKYLQQSELSNAVTKKVVSNDDGLLCAEIIREFMDFYKMDYSLQVFVPEMSLSVQFPKSRWDMEREIGIQDAGDTSKPLLLKLLEHVKYGDTVAPVKKSVNENLNPNNNLWQSNFEADQQHNQKDENKVKEEKKTKKKKDGSKKKGNKKKNKPQQDIPSSNTGGSSLSTLNDLPSLGGPKKTAKIDQNAFDFDDLEGDNNDAESDYGSKYSKVQSQLNEFEKEVKMGYQMKAPKRNQDSNDIWQLENIEEDIQSEHDNAGGQHYLAESAGAGFGITVSQSLGIDPSVDSLALDDFDHIERVE